MEKTGNERRVVLASQSPRRQELLKLLFETFEVIVSEVDECLPDNIAPDAAVEQLALRKAQAVHPLAQDALVIGADTVVAIDGEILGKPQNREDAARMLRRLSDRTHAVYTGVAVLCGSIVRVFSVCTQVEFCQLSEIEIRWYLGTGEPFDKAGSYGIQGYGARYVKGIEGDYYNVMGLPVNRLYAEIGDLSSQFR